MEDVFESDAKIHMVMEIMQGGELFDYVVEKGTLSESEASVMVRKVSFAGKLPLLSTADVWCVGPPRVPARVDMVTISAPCRVCYTSSLARTAPAPPPTPQNP